MPHNPFNDWLLTPHRLAIHRPTACAVIADVHLGYREARQQAGEAVPLLSTRAQLRPLWQALKRFDFRTLLVAGDLFERCVRTDLLDEFLAELKLMKVAFAGLVPGNHDRGWADIQDRITVLPDGAMLGEWRILHGHEAPSTERCVLGHWHPATTHLGRRVPCYLAGPRCLVLPAFSADAAGGPIRAHATLSRLDCHAIVGKRVVLCGAARPARAAKSPRQGIRGLHSRANIASR